MIVEKYLGRPNGPLRPYHLGKMGRPMAHKIGIEAMGLGPRRSGRPIPHLEFTLYGAKKIKS